GGTCDAYELIYETDQDENNPIDQHPTQGQGDRTEGFTPPPVPVCGDGEVNGDDQCELPSTNDNEFCSQSTNSCQGNKTGSRDSFGSCSEICQCQIDSFSFACQKGSCGATCNPGEQQVESCGFNNVGICKLGNKTRSCDDNSCNFGNFGECVGEILPGEEVCNQLDDDCDGQVDEGNVCYVPACGNGILDTNEQCDDGNLANGDGCSSICQKEFCGDNIVNNNTEQCEPPSSNNNQFCSQTQTQCFNNKTGSRDNLGFCSASCGCAYDQFDIKCVKGSCGATCSVGETQTESCGVTDVGECKLGNKTKSCDGNSCSFGDFGQCTGNIDPVQEICDEKDNDCDGQVDEGNVCYVPACGNGIKDAGEECDDNNLISGDGCSSICQKEFCGDGTVNNVNEQCELPSTNNNAFCAQTQTQCFNNKTGSRDNLGFCSASCGCAYDQFDIKCVKGSCGATCNPGEQQVESCGFNNVGICKLGNKTKSCDGNSCNFGNFGECVGEILPGEEVCNQLDDDCDGKVDEGDVCKIVCGNGKLEEGEECDDGNNIGGDGCNSICQKDLVCIYDKSKPGLGVQGSPQLNQVEQAQSIGTATERFPVLLWMDPARRITYDDFNEPGRINKTILVERINNYAFEGEQISWDVFAFDKNGIEKLGDVFVSIGPVHGPGNDIEANCKINKRTDDPCAVIGETEKVKFNPQTSRWYTCTLTVETPESMYGEYFITVEAEDLDGKKSSIDENEFWFLNPVIGLNINGEIDFGDLRPGTIGYAKTLLVENNADPGSGVLLDMFISGTDFYDPINSGAKCPTSNKLELKNFRYYATSGAYSTKGNPGADSEGYRKIPYEVTGTGGKINNGRQDIIHNGKLPGGYSSGNVLSPGAELAITFKLALPEPCNGDFSSGQIMFWGEAI
ncbi:MAG TPA: DUF4215 domain-containing protein, partial [Candidatus Nanoarchaeia archaeon]|nr:DUF4215 domain-containing protein [Candidatus Nanoarchaeia archaeon]